MTCCDRDKMTIPSERWDIQVCPICECINIDGVQFYRESMKFTSDTAVECGVCGREDATEIMVSKPLNFLDDEQVLDIHNDDDHFPKVPICDTCQEKHEVLG